MFLTSGKKFVKFKNIVSECIMLLISLFIIVPYLMVILGSFKSLKEASEMTLKLPTKWYILENYSQVFLEGNILVGFRNSIVNVAAVVLLTVLLTSITAFILQRRNDKLSKILIVIFSLGIIMSTNIVTVVLLMKRLHLKNILGVILVETASKIGFCSLLYIKYISGISREIDESAHIEGCGPVKLFFSIIFPLLKPMTATVVIFSAMTVWNNFATPLYLLNDSRFYTIGLSLYYFIGEFGSNMWNLIFASIVIVSAPIMIIYLFMQQQIIAGLTKGAIK